MARGFRDAVNDRISYFLEHHERSFRTEIVLVPALVVAIKLAIDVLPGWSTPWMIAAIIGLALFSYLFGLLVVIIVGDAFAHWLARKINQMKQFEGIYLQNRGHIARQRAIARIFFDRSRRKWIYRGIAYSDDSPTSPAAAWEAIMARHDRVDGDMVFYFAGKAEISNCYEYHPETFTRAVFIILRFTGTSRFKGAGFDFEWKERRDGTRESFPIEGVRVDRDYLRSRNVSDGLLDSLAISKPDRERIFLDFAGNSPGEVDVPSMD